MSIEKLTSLNRITKKAQINDYLKNNELFVFLQKKEKIQPTDDSTPKDNALPNGISNKNLYLQKNRYLLKNFIKIDLVEGSIIELQRKI